ncbi:competence ComEA-like helix-hairpin-helix protein [Lacibacter cauensis]|uniref:Competence ComEA-like helix-hairpin-helix protein n=1 Tax=Lacibacter cauensis TaxID=510947 RepID=A0A562SRE5_9BACT|nr:helix-hairpin-helix domain-containing protein [Lacibacter cauensis]TWI83708.1 competence ComEA-like helix-hairpin-helix protein [Lacibacter cauensis]
MQFTRPHWIKEYFSFTKKERNATLLLAAAALLFSLLPSIFPFLVKNDLELTVDTTVQQQLAALQTIETEKGKVNDEYDDASLFQPKESQFEKYQRKKQSSELFYFDPNNATADEWKRLGVREKTVATILKYRSKGGKFYKPEDLKRIYGLRPDEAERLLPFVSIEAKQKPASVTENSTVETSYTKERKEFTKIVVDINSSDTSDWKLLRGIGSGYARRIVNFRNKLGGFVSVDQVAETYGLPDSVFQQIKPQLKNTTADVRKISLNNSTVEQLKAHPYIGFSVANAIVQYRKEHGSFSSITELQKIGAIDEKLYQKISPYLQVE